MSSSPSQPLLAAGVHAGGLQPCFVRVSFLRPISVSPPPPASKARGCGGPEDPEFAGPETQRARPAVWQVRLVCCEGTFVCPGSSLPLLTPPSPSGPLNSSSGGGWAGAVGHREQPGRGRPAGCVTPSGAVGEEGRGRRQLALPTITAMAEPDGAQSRLTPSRQHLGPSGCVSGPLPPAGHKARQVLRARPQLWAQNLVPQQRWLLFPGRPFAFLLQCTHVAAVPEAPCHVVLGKASPSCVHGGPSPRAQDTG